METVIFVTGNQYKFQVAQKALENLDINLVQKDLKTPEIQSTEVEEIASFSARWASNKLQKPVVLTDAGYYIQTLNGFPGPFIKYVNYWLTADDFLRLMRGKKNRTVICKDCLAYCEPGKKPITFLGTAKGKIAEKAGKKGILRFINFVYINHPRKINLTEKIRAGMENFKKLRNEILIQQDIDPDSQVWDIRDYAKHVLYNGNLKMKRGLFDLFDYQFYLQNRNLTTLRAH